MEFEATSGSTSPELFCEEALDETTQAVPATPQQPGTDSESPMEADSSDDGVAGSSESMNEVAAQEPGPSISTPVRKRRRRSYVTNFLTGKARLVL